MRLNIDLQHANEISAIESKADFLIEKNTFEHVLSAINMYSNAQELLENAMNLDESLKNNVNYRLWKEKLASKLNAATAILASPKLKSYEA